MPLTLIESGKQRPPAAGELEELLKPHPAPIAMAARQLIESQNVVVRLNKLLALTVPALHAAARREIYTALSDSGPADSRPLDASIAALAGATDVPVYQFIKPPMSLVAAEPLEIGVAGATRICSAYRDDGPDVMKRGNIALAALAKRRYQIPDGVNRAEAMSEMAGLFTSVAAAARSFPMMVVSPTPRYLELAPGELPAFLSGVLESFVRSTRPEEVLNVPLLNQIGRALGNPESRPPVGLTLDEVAIFYAGIDEKLWELTRYMPELMEQLLNGMASPWWIEGDSLSRPRAPKPEDLKSGAGEHLVIPGLAPPTSAPPLTPIPQPPAGTAPIVLVISDLHLGQGYWDNADEGYPELEAALVEMLAAWKARVEQHRAAHGLQQPAYLVLNGDVLDFWSADLTEMPGGGNRFDLDVENDNGAPRVTRAIANGRMRRILDAHSTFFKGIRAWVDSAALNFVIYVCGNHDDHLERFNLGEALADELGGPRGAFAAKSLYFPELCTIIEHGHRKDTFNAWQGHGTEVGTHGSLGEILVALMVNPAERGSGSALTMMDADFSGHLQNSGIGASRLGQLSGAYSHFRRCYEVEPSVYHGCMGCIDNIDTGGLEEAVADYSGRELVFRDSDEADDADVCKLDDDLDRIKRIWVKDDFQDLTTRLLAPKLARLLTPSQQSWLIDKIFAGDHAEALGFKPGQGLFSNPQQRIHIVGHTHRPEATSPPIDGRQVWAQHVNTGTGQDTWTPDDDDKFDGEDLADSLLAIFRGAVENSEDRLTPTPKSNYCILQVAPVILGGVYRRMFIEAGEFRSLQTHRPQDTPQEVRGGLSPKGVNTTFLN